MNARSARLDRLAEWLRIPPHELRYGTEIEKRVKQERARWDEGIGYLERETFESFLSLPAPQRKTVREIIQTFAKAFPADVAIKQVKPRKK